MSLTNDEHHALIKAALAARDRQWEDCLRVADEAPPLVPDPDWVRAWVERVRLGHTNEEDIQWDEGRHAGIEEALDVIVALFQDLPLIDDRDRNEMIATVKKELDDYNAQ